MLKKSLFIIFLLFGTISAMAIDYSGDFSERSVIMRNIFGVSKLEQEQKELLKTKKLAPNVQCMMEQIKKGNIENVKLLLQANVDPNKSYMSDYPIYIAARCNQTEIVKLLRQNGAKIDRGFYSELYEALRNKNAELAQYLIDEGARVNYQDSITNNTILYMSLKNNMHDISKELILKGANADNKSVAYIRKHKLQSLIPND